VLSSRCGYLPHFVKTAQSASVARRSFEPRTEPTLGFLCALDDLLVELVNRRVEFLAGASKLLLCLRLCLFVLLPRLDAVLVELCLGLLRLSLGLVCLWDVSNAQKLNQTAVTYVLLSSSADCLVALLAGLLRFLVLAREVTLDAPYGIGGVV
jgi:hypothetical protein